MIWRNRNEKLALGSWSCPLRGYGSWVPPLQALQAGHWVWWTPAQAQLFIHTGLCARHHGLQRRRCGLLCDAVRGLLRWPSGVKTTSMRVRTLQKKAQTLEAAYSPLTTPWPQPERPGHQGWISEGQSPALEVSDSGGLQECQSGGSRRTEDQIPTKLCGSESTVYADQHRGSGVGCPWKAGVQEEQWGASWPPFRLTSNMAKTKDGRCKRDGIQMGVEVGLRTGERRKPPPQPAFQCPPQGSCTFTFQIKAL